MQNYLDADHWKVAQLIDELNAAATELRTMQIINQLRPTLSKDGNQYCYILGELPNNCCMGFGDTVWLAMLDFHNNLVNEKAKSFNNS